MPTQRAQKGQAKKHVPMRTCAACRTTKPKRELLRIVRLQDGHVELDPAGKKSGRGTYLCAKHSCWDLALKKGRLEREFELEILLHEDREKLEAYRDTLPADA